MNMQSHLRLVADVKSVKFESFRWQEHDPVDVVGVRSGPKSDGSRLGLGQTFESQTATQLGAEQLVRNKHHRLNYSSEKTQQYVKMNTFINTKETRHEHI